MIAPLTRLLLVHLLAQRKEAPTPSVFLRDLARFHEQWSPSEWRDRISDSLAEAGAEGLVEVIPGRSPKYASTDDGKEVALSFLDAASVGEGVSWDKLCRQYLTPLAMGIAFQTSKGRSEFAQADRFRAAILAWKEGLPTSRTPTLKQALSSLAWRELGVESTEDISSWPVICHLLSKRMGAEARLEKSKLIQLLPAHVLGTASTDASKLRATILRTWFESLPHDTSATPQAPLSEFAREAREAAASSPTGRFGNDKVFISHAWRQYANGDAGKAMDLAAFKDRLLEAYEGRLLDMCRADVTRLMDAQDVAESEIVTDRQEFHFILLR